MAGKRDSEIRGARGLMGFGLVAYLAGFLFAVLDGFEYGWVREDAFVLGSLALSTGIVLWVGERLGNVKAAIRLVRGFFVVVALLGVYVVWRIIVSDVSLAGGLLLSACVSVLLLGVWKLTWGATLSMVK